MLKQRLLTTLFILCNILVLQAQSANPDSINTKNAKGSTKDGIGILTEQTPIHSEYVIEPREVRSFQIRNGKVEIHQKELKTREQAVGFDLTFNSAIGMENHTALPDIQSEYAQGQSQGGNLQWFGPETGEHFAWGPALKTLEFDGSAYDYDKNGRLVPAGTGSGIPARAYGIKDFFRTGLFTDNNINIRFPLIGRDLYAVAKIGQYQKDSPIRNSDFKSTNVSLTVRGIEFNDFKAEASGAYNNSEGHLLPAGSNMATLLYSLLMTPPTFDNTNGLKAKDAASGQESWKLANGNMRSFAPVFADNPYAFLNALPDKEKGDQWLTSAQVTFRDDSHEGFKATLKGDYQKLTSNKTNGWPAGFTTYATERLSLYDTDESQGGFQFSPAYKWDDYYNKKISAFADYSFNYQKKELNYQNSQPIAGDQFYGSRTTNELRYGVDIDLTSDGYNRSTYRIILSNRNYFSNTTSDFTNFLPYAGVKADFSRLVSNELWDEIRDFRISLNAGKSAHEAPLVYKDPAVISTNFISSQDFRYYFESEAIYAHSSLKPEMKVEYNAALSTNMGSKFLLDVEYFNATTENFVAPVRQNSRFALDNVAKVNNSGWNIAGSLYKYRGYHDFSFSISANWSTYKNIVKETKDDAYIPIAGFQNISTGMREGNPLGAIYGTSWLRDDQGRRLIGNDGFPLVNNNISMIGDPTPDWTAGISPYFGWKGFTLEMTLTFRKGGDMWNGTAAALDYAGMSQNTADQRNIKGYVFEGVNQMGQPNQTPVDFYNPTQPTSDNRWVRYGMEGVGEEYIQDASCLRLSDASFRYKFRLDSNLFRELIIGISGYNLLTFTKYKGSDPSSTLFNNTSGKGLDLFNLPGTRSYVFNVKLRLGK